MIDVTITIVGPGGTIDYEAVVIRRALEAAGVRVVEENTNPCSDPDECLRVIRDRLDTGYIKHKAVRLVVTHQPWGG
jgi:hypothetical protein